MLRKLKAWEILTILSMLLTCLIFCFFVAPLFVAAGASFERQNAIGTIFGGAIGILFVLFVYLLLFRPFGRGKQQSSGRQPFRRESLRKKPDHS